MWKLRKFTLTLFWQKFRESNGFTKEVTLKLISRNFSFFRAATHAEWKLREISLTHIQKFRESNGFTK